MSDNLNIKLLKQHAAILETALQTVNNVSKSITEEAAALRFVMAGGDPCRVCAVKCTFGEGNCKPVWRGEAGADL
jgi:hypothetical protein